MLAAVNIWHISQPHCLDCFTAIIKNTPQKTQGQWKGAALSEAAHIFLPTFVKWSQANRNSPFTLRFKNIPTLLSFPLHRAEKTAGHISEAKENLWGQGPSWASWTKLELAHCRMEKGKLKKPRKRDLTMCLHVMRTLLITCYSSGGRESAEWTSKQEQIKSKKEKNIRIWKWAEISYLWANTDVAQQESTCFEWRLPQD